MEREQDKDPDFLFRALDFTKFKMVAVGGKPLVDAKTHIDRELAENDQEDELDLDQKTWSWCCDTCAWDEYAGTNTPHRHIDD